MRRGIRCAAGCLLAVCVLLSGCTGLNREEKQQEPAPAPSTLLESASGLPEKETLLRIDGREVPAWRYLYWLAGTCDRLAQRYEEAGLPLDWSAPVSGGNLADYAKDQALADAALYAVVENWADAYLPERPAGETSAAGLPEQGLTKEQMEELESVGDCYAALWELCRKGTGPLSPAEEDLAEYGQETGALTLDRILVPAGEGAGERAAELFSQLNGAEDQAALFSRLAAEGDDPQGPRTVLPGDDTLEESLLEAARALEENQCSGILESQEGFSILRRLPLDGQALLESWFDSTLREAARTARVTTGEAYESLDAAAFYNALQIARQRETRT